MNIRTRVRLSWIAFCLIGAVAQAGIPDELGSNGLVVGFVLLPSTMDVHSTSLFFDGKRGSLNSKDTVGGYFGVSLKPGTHKLTAVNYRDPLLEIQFQVERAFVVEPGKVTNLGLIGLLLDFRRGDPGPYPFEVFFADNTPEMTAWIAHAHPKLYASLGQKEFLKPAEGFIDADQLQTLRAEALDATLRAGRWQAQSPSAKHVTGALGALAWIRESSSGPQLQLLDTQTVRDLRECDRSGDRTVCLLSKSRFMLAIRDRVTMLPVPPGTTANTIRLAGDQLLLLDESMKMLVSKDDGSSWQSIEAPVLQKPIQPSKYVPDVLNFTGATVGAAAVYVYSKNQDKKNSVVLSAPTLAGPYSPLALPEGIQLIKAVYEVPAGLYVLTGTTGWTEIGSKLFFLAAGSSSWTIGRLEYGDCFDLAFRNPEGTFIEIGCIDGRSFGSKDSGATWVQFVER